MDPLANMDKKTRDFLKEIGFDKFSEFTVMGDTGVATYSQADLKRYSNEASASANNLTDNADAVDDLTTDPVDNSTGDPVDNFFKRLPLPPKDGPSPQGMEAFNRARLACNRFVSEYQSRKSSDPDAEYILEHIKKSKNEPLPVAYIFQQIALLALSKGVAEDDKSDKANHLRFCRWLAQGRRDDCHPSATGPGEDSASGNSKAFLPEDAAIHKCAECGKADGVKNCTECVIRTDDHVTFATAYCSKECQAKNRPKHRALCKQLQTIHRAMLLYQDVLEHYFTITFPTTYVAKGITEQYVMVGVKYIDSTTVYSGKHGLWSTFPHELAPSTDAARAALMHSRCAQILDGDHARALLEMLIRPACTKIERVAFEPKNMDKPVHITHPDWDELNSVMNHEVLLATLACGEVVALDPTGIQFGWKENIAPWDSYLQHRISHLAERQVVPPMRPGSRFEVSANNMAGAGVTSSANSMLMEGVVLGLLPHIKKEFGGVSELLNLEKGEFNENRNAIITAAHGGLSMLAEEIKGSAVMMVDPRGLGGLTDPDHAEVEMVWCTEQERNEAARNPGAFLKAKYRWNARWQNAVRPRLPKNKVMDEIVDSISIDDMLKSLEACFEDLD